MTSKRFEYGHLSEGGFKRGEILQEERNGILAAFGAAGLVHEVLERVNDGKEATIYRCSAGPGIDADYVVAKVYRARKFRAFRNEFRYMDVSGIRDRRAARAVQARSQRGRGASLSMWVQREWELLNLLWDKGALVPRPWSYSEPMILMECCRNGDRPASRLVDTILSPGAEARQWFDALIREIELYLSLDIIHGDLSPYNVLAVNGSPLVIDFPQAVDARFCPDAPMLLFRDVDNICAYFSRLGVPCDAQAIAIRMWTEYQSGQLIA